MSLTPMPVHIPSKLLHGRNEERKTHLAINSSTQNPNDIKIMSWCCTCHDSLTHWGRVTHICVSKRTIIGSDNGLSPSRRQAIIWTNAGILLIGPSGTNFSEILIEIITFSFKKMRLKVSSAKWRPCCLGLNVLANITGLCTAVFHRRSLDIF